MTYFEWGFASMSSSGENVRIRGPMTATVVSELQALCALAAAESESQQDFARRLVVKANTIPDTDWETLSSATQVWVNSALEALEAKTALPLPPGIEALGLSEALFDAPSKPKAKKSAPTKKTPSKTSVKAAPASKKKAPAKPAAKSAKQAAGGSRRGPRGNFSLSDKITEVAENPYRAGSKTHPIYNKYRNGMTVAAAIEAGVSRAHIRYDARRGNIKLVAA